MKHLLTAAAFAVAFGLPAAGRAMTDGDYKSQHARVRAEERAALQKCNNLAANAKDICIAEARGAAQVATAELDARRRSFDPQARRDLRIAKAQAEHDISKEKCDDLAGNVREVCLKDARTILQRTKSEAEADRKAGESASASRDRVASTARNAEYDAAVKRCDTRTGDAKDRCVADAKVRFGVK